MVLKVRADVVPDSGSWCAVLVYVAVDTYQQGEDVVSCYYSVSYGRSDGKYHRLRFLR